MKKTYCDRCGKEIRYDPRQQAILPTYNISYAIYNLYNHFDLCDSCQIEFNNWMKNWLKEKRNDN